MNRVSLGLAVAVAVAVACADPPTLVIAPVIDTPAEGAPGAAFPDVDELVFSLARAGAPGDLVAATFTRGQPVELFQVPAGDDLVLHLLGRRDGIELAYGRTCTFSIPVEVDGPAPTPRLFFARTVHWTVAPDPTVLDRHHGLAATYHDGSAMFAGGVTATAAPVTAVERFDPRTGGFVPVVELAPRRAGSMVGLGDGRQVLFGGVDDLGATSARVEVIEVEASPGQRVEVFDDARLALRGAATATLADGRAMVFGGRGPDELVRGEVIELDGAAPTIEVRVGDAHLTVARDGATATRLSDDLGAPVVIIGGRDSAGAPVGLAELYKPLLGRFASPASFAPTMVVPRTGHHAVRLPDGSVLVLGGVDAAGVPVAQLELFSVDGGFTAAGRLPDRAGLIDATVTALPDGRVLVAGGRTAIGAPPTDACFVARLNPGDGSIDVVATDPLVSARAGHQAARLCDGSVVVVGGGAGAERYDPPPAGRR